MARKSKKNQNEEVQVTESSVENTTAESTASEVQTEVTSESTVEDKTAVSSDESAANETEKAAEPTNEVAPQTEEVKESEPAEETVTDKTDGQSVAETTEKKADKKDKKKKGFKIGPTFANESEKIKNNGPLLFFTCVGCFLIMGFACAAIFMANVKGSEKVLVPDVSGKQLTDALQELQVKELYPKITLRYSQVPGDEGTILEQDPVPGSIIKGYNRVNLVVSRGVVKTEVGEYIGKTLDEVQQIVAELYGTADPEENAAGETENPVVKPFISFAAPKYVANAKPAGTIIEQDPLPGSEVYGSVKVNLVISKGPYVDDTAIPALSGYTVNDMLQAIAKNRIAFDISSHVASESETPGTVTKQQSFKTQTIASYSKMTVDMAMPAAPVDGNAYGIFSAEVPVYPYPMEMKIVAKPENDSEYTIVSFKHPGGKVTAPFIAAEGTTLELYVDGTPTAQYYVE